MTTERAPLLVDARQFVKPEAGRPEPDAGSGRTILRCINRMNDLLSGSRAEGEVIFEGEDVSASGLDPVDVRRRIGMVFQKPNPFPKSIYENAAFGPRINGLRG